MKNQQNNKQNIIENTLKTSIFVEKKELTNSVTPINSNTGINGDKKQIIEKKLESKLVTNFENLIAGKYRLLKKIGSGSFGEVYHAINITNNREVAVKIESNEVTPSQVNHESRIYRLIQDGKHVPHARLCTTLDNKYALVIDLLGPSLEELFQFCDCKFSIKTVCMLADQMINVIEYIHQKSLIHCDIKPDNFLMGICQQSNRVYIIDFGLSKQFRFGSRQNHAKYNNNRSLTGTARYVSINGHVGIALSRRDDLESIGYVLVYFCVKCLPWQGIQCRGRKQKYDRICESKLSTPVTQLCKNLPMEFMLYINYCRHLRYDETPDYSFIKSLFRSILKTFNQKYDLIFDWLLPKYTDPMKEYLFNTSASFSMTLTCMNLHHGIYTSPLVGSRKLPNITDNTLSQMRSDYYHSFFSRYPFLDPDKFYFSIKTFYRNYFTVPPSLLTPINNICGLQSSNLNNQKEKSGFSLVNHNQTAPSGFSRFNEFSKK